MLDLLLRGGNVVLPREGIFRADLGIRAGKVAFLGRGETVSRRETLDVSGLHLFPGVFDPHVHIGVRGPYEEECLTETRSALLGGITTIGCYLRERESYHRVFPDLRATAEARAFTDLLFHFVILLPEQIPEIASYHRAYGISSFKFYMHAIPGIPIMEDGNLLAAFREVARLGKDALRGRGPSGGALVPETISSHMGAIACLHAENASLVRSATEAARRNKTCATLKDWMDLSPVPAEAEAVQRGSILARAAGVRLYIVHLTSKEGLREVREARRKGTLLHCETTSPNLFFSTEDPAGMAIRRVPPIRTPRDQEALWEGVREGTIETLGTDNVTATAEENNSKAPDGTPTPFWETRGGFPFLGTHLPSILHAGYHERGIPLHRLADALSRRPAELFGLYPRKGNLLPGGDADVVAVDISLEKEVRGELLGSRAKWSPLEGRRLRGWPVMTFKGGRLAAREGRVLVEPGCGRWLSGRAG